MVKTIDNFPLSEHERFALRDGAKYASAMDFHKPPLFTVDALPWAIPPENYEHDPLLTGKKSLSQTWASFAPPPTTTRGGNMPFGSAGKLTKFSQRRLDVEAKLASEESTEGSILLNFYKVLEELGSLGDDCDSRIKQYQRG